MEKDSRAMTNIYRFLLDKIRKFQGSLMNNQDSVGLIGIMQNSSGFPFNLRESSRPQDVVTTLSVSPSPRVSKDPDPEKGICRVHKITCMSYVSMAMPGVSLPISS